MNPSRALNPSDPAPALLFIRGRAACDAGGVLAAPGAVLVRLNAVLGDTPGVRCELLAAGTPDDVSRHALAPGARAVECPDAVLIPGLINAHTHLDLTSIGPIAHEPADGFVAWVNQVRSRRAQTRESVAAAVARGVELSLAGGVVAVGDIAGAVQGVPCAWAAEALSNSSLSGVSYLEFFGIGAHEPRAAALLKAIALDVARSSAEGGPVRLGLQPHAPYSVSLELFQEVASFARHMGVRVATHLSESPEELEFVASGTGPLADLLREVDAWDESMESTFTNPGVTPVRWLEPALRQARFVAAHVNHCDDADIEVLVKSRTSVAYCPRASAYFGAPDRLGPHRYRELLAAGVNVILGTDSLLNLPAQAADPATGGMSTLDEMRLLYRRDGTDPSTLLAMGTTGAARGLGFHPASFLLSGPLGGPIGGVVAVPIAGEAADDPLAAIMESDAPPSLLVHGMV
ncbi:MAG: amidohydrolase family protein [Phycisphaerales bacterium]